MNADSMQGQRQSTRGLLWTRAEVDRNLTAARQLMEQALETPGDAGLLQQAAAQLHEVRGSSTLIQCFGVALLAEEMKQTLHDLLAQRIKEVEAAYSALLGATVQASDYLDLLAQGQKDCTLILQPLLNELRLLRGKSLFTESDLFVAQFNALGLRLPPPDLRLLTPFGAQREAERLMPVYQAALGCWVRGEEATQNLGRLGKIAERLATHCSEPVLHQLWRTTAACVEALLSKTLGESLELKRLFARTGQQIRALADAGETTAARNSGDLPLRLLFFAGRSMGRGPRISYLSKALELDVYLPSAEIVQQLRARLRGPNTLLLRRVAEELRADLADIKDTVDLALRTGGRAQIDLAATGARLRRVADTLGMLGLEPEQRALLQELELMGGVHGADGLSEQSWMEFATGLLGVELSLDEALYRQLHLRPAAGAAAGMPLASSGLREGINALLRESLVNLARLKPYVDTYIRSNDASGLPEASRLLDEIAAGFRVIGAERADHLILQVQRYLQAPAFRRTRSGDGSAERFADAIAAIEYLLESQRDGLPEAEAVLDDLHRRVLRLDFTYEYPEDSETALPADLGQPIELLDDSVDTPPLPARAAGPAPRLPPEVAAKAGPAAEAVDPEIREIFLAEAEEVLAGIHRALPRWMRHTGEREHLLEIRRAFHTLKGSGRMVGASRISEFSLALEGMLNRCLDGAISITPTIVDAVEEAVALLPRLISDFRYGSTAQTGAVETLAERARQLSAGRGEGEQPGLVGVFRADADERLDWLRRWLSEQNRNAVEIPIDDGVVRAFHTLRGAAFAVGAQAIGDLSDAFETWLQTRLRSGQALNPAGLALLDEAVTTLFDWVAQLGQPGVPAADAGAWLNRMAELIGTQDADAADAADRELAEIFASEALDLVQKFEECLNAWARQPDARFNALTLKTLVHTLKGAAAMSSCTPVAAVAQALNLRMEAFAVGLVPRPGFFAALLRIVEGLYDQLDRFREGTLSGEGEELVALVAALDPELNVAAPVESAAADAESDREMQEIFLAEGEELIGEIEHQAFALRADADDAAALSTLERALHTLKGSARMAGFGALGDVAHRLKQIVDEFSFARPDAPDNFLYFHGRLSAGTRGLRQLLEDVRENRRPDPTAALREIDAPPAQAAAVVETPVEETTTVAPPETLAEPAALSQIADEVPEHAVLPFELAPEPEPVAAFEPEVEPEPQAQPIPESAQEPEPTPLHVPVEPEPVSEPELEPPLRLTVDAEMAAMFAPEAAELLETLAAELAGWRADAGDLGFARAMQHALHTLKGGARMAGLNRMGSAAHDMETRIAHAEQTREPPTGSTFDQLARELEILLQMHDSLERGDLEPLAASGFELPEEPVVAPVQAPRDVAWNPELFWQPEAGSAGQTVARRETARVPVERLDGMLNQAGEISIFRARLEENHAAMLASLYEMAQTVTRVREQLRMLDIETEAQIAARGFARGGEDHRYESHFDPLELDRYSRMQELSRALAESANDLVSLHTSMDATSAEGETLLQQQGRVNTEVQQQLMGTLMVPFSRQMQRLERVVRQTAQENGKLARAEFSGAESELDRNVLERMTGPLEHLLRNSVVHGIESADERRAAGKPEEGLIAIDVKREGSQLLIELRDDGRGLNYVAIREQAVARGLISSHSSLSHGDLARFIFAPGFTTASQLTQDAGRGVGLAVVASEVRQLGGTVDVISEAGRGLRFAIRLPLMLAVSQALLVHVGEELFALPLASVEGIVRIAREQVPEYYGTQGRPLVYADRRYRVRYLGELLGRQQPDKIETRTVSAILVRLGSGTGEERGVAVIVDRMLGNREIVSKAVGPILSSVAGVSGATILADGRVVVILDVPALMQEHQRRTLVVQPQVEAVASDARELIMVVDDSITMRRVAERLLSKNGYRVITAKDGLDAMAMLQTESPAAILLDIEMPRADGFEVAAFIRNTVRIAQLPIIMITSRSGDKHRQHATSLGVNQYLVKPYQEDHLLRELRVLIDEARKREMASTQELAT